MGPYPTFLVNTSDKEDDMSTPTVYKKGDLFLRRRVSKKEELYVLALTGIDKKSGNAEMNLVSINDGDRWTNPVEVGNCVAITEEEMSFLFREATFIHVMADSITVKRVTYETIEVKI